MVAFDRSNGTAARYLGTGQADGRIGIQSYGVNLKIFKNEQGKNVRLQGKRANVFRIQDMGAMNPRDMWQTKKVRQNRQGLDLYPGFVG